MPIATAISRTAWALGLSMIPVAILVRWPEERRHMQHSALSSSADFAPTPTDVQYDYEAGETVSLTSSSAKIIPEQPLGYERMVKTPNFWLYITIIFTTGASFSIHPYYYKIGLLFGASFDTLVFWYNFASISSSVLGLLGSALMDHPCLRTRSGFWSSSSRNVILVLLGVQPMAMLLMIVADDRNSFTLFIFARCVLSLVVSLHFNAAVLLARDVFANDDAARAFGIGAGVSLALGDSASVVLMAATLRVAAGAAGPNTTRDFNLFYVIAAAWSAVGVLCTILIKPRTQKVQ